MAITKTEVMQDGHNTGSASVGPHDARAVVEDDLTSSMDETALFGALEEEFNVFWAETHAHSDTE
eukprot:5621222-Amphidinium_carterae.1